jgi:Protein of unknown function (DUF2933)
MAWHDIHIGRNTLVVIGLGGLGAVALAFFAGLPLTSILVFGLVLGCPLMMMFMMQGGHDNGGARDNPVRVEPHDTLPG